MSAPPDFLDAAGKRSVPCVDAESKQPDRLTRVSADDALHAMGYTEELTRNRSTFQVAFMSFVLASIPYGLATQLSIPIVGGGPVDIIWGWVGVSCIIFCVAISLAEITSVYPTAGGVYYQSFILSPPSYRKVVAWLCGWCYLAGNITITLSVNFGTAVFFVACINDLFEGIFPGEAYQVFLVFIAITLLTNVISALGNRWLPLLDTMAVIWTLLGLVAISVCTLALAKNGRRSADFVFTEFVPSSGWAPGWSFCVGLLHAGYATSSTGMIISMCEEVKSPSTQVPRAMVGTVVINFIAGLIFLIPLCFVLPDLDELNGLVSAQPVPTIFKYAVGSAWGAIALLIPLLILGILCGTACTTAASRCTWAFARDGAIPGHKWWKLVNAKLNVPLNAMMLSMVVQILLGVIYFGSTAAFNAFSGVGVVFLTVSYAIPILVSLVQGRKHIAKGVFDMGSFGLFCNIVSIAWTALAVPLFVMPVRVPVTVLSVNYAPVVFVGTLLISLGYYMVARKHYKGPPTDGDTVLEAHSRLSVS